MLPQNYRVCIYPKYDEVHGFQKHSFYLSNVCEQEPQIYKGNRKYWNNHKHIAIIF